MYLLTVAQLYELRDQLLDTAYDARKIPTTDTSLSQLNPFVMCGRTQGNMLKYMELNRAMHSPLVKLAHNI